MKRIAHLVVSTHWDREWYEPFQGYRMRLVSLLDEVLETLERDPSFKSFMTDAQSIVLMDYLEIRPERAQQVRDFLRTGRLIAGPWYVLPDEWLVSGESIIRNIELGQAVARELGGEPMRAGMVVDQFGHVGQLPQIFAKLGFPMAFVWRGTNERDVGGAFRWQSPDGTTLPTYRFGRAGYPTHEFKFRSARDPNLFPTFDEQAELLAQAVLDEAARSPLSTILMYTGGDHMEIEPRTTDLVRLANLRLRDHGIEIEHSTIAKYIDAVLGEQSKITNVLEGELRESGRDPMSVDEQWLIPGVLSSRIHLKQRNAACEDELTQWAEPFSSFAAAVLGVQYPAGYLRHAWMHLLQNHAHDSIGGCSIDAVHRDMIYRFDQSQAIASRLTNIAMRSIALASTPSNVPDDAITLTVFNANSRAIDEPIDLDIPLPADWPTKFSEFLDFEEKFALVLRDALGNEIPYQLTEQRRNRTGFHRTRYRFPKPDVRHVVSVTARLAVPALGYATVIVEPRRDSPTRYPGTQMTDHRSIENEFLRVTVNSNGTIRILDKRSDQVYDEILAFEDSADIGDGWYHGPAVNDRVCLSTGSRAAVSVVCDGRFRSTLRIASVVSVPASFEFDTMRRATATTELTLTTDVTLRAGEARVECQTTVDNAARDHRLRVLLPTNARADRYMADSTFDVVERNVALAADNASRRELDVETRPQQTWTAVCDATRGLAIVSRGLPESAVIDRPDRAIALTLLRATKRVIFADDNDGGQMPGSYASRYDIIPIGSSIDATQLCRDGQRVASPCRTISLLARDRREQQTMGKLPPNESFVQLDGECVMTSARLVDGKLQVRLFNPLDTATRATLRTSVPVIDCAAVRLEGDDDRETVLERRDGNIVVDVSPKRIVTISCTLRSKNVELTRA